MTPEAQSILAAEIVGWKQHGEPQVPWASWKHPDYVAPHDARPHMKGRYGVATPPSFHIDANASLQLLDWMRLPDNGGWSARWNYAARDDYHRFTFSGGDSEIVYDARTLPLAILGAFLRANGKEIE